MKLGRIAAVVASVGPAVAILRGHVGKPSIVGIEGPLEVETSPVPALGKRHSEANSSTSGTNNSRDEKFSASEGSDSLGQQHLAQVAPEKLNTSQKPDADLTRLYQGNASSGQRERRESAPKPMQVSINVDTNQTRSPDTASLASKTNITESANVSTESAPQTLKVIFENVTNTDMKAAVKPDPAGTPDFVTYYQSLSNGRGIWKWNNALEAYDRHLGHFKGTEVVGAEIGVQSGGSLEMWGAVLGEGLQIHGLDINPNCRKFADNHTDITIGDQESPDMWHAFFTDTAPTGLDFLVDDGGHEAGQMLVTFQSVWPRLHHGGILFIEDIHSEDYLFSFFKPLGAYLSRVSNVASVHLYSYLLGVEKQKDGVLPYDPSTQHNAKVQPVEIALDQLELSLLTSPRGRLVVVKHHDVFSEAVLVKVFALFIGLYQPEAMPDSPPGCATTSANLCVYGTTNSFAQSRVEGVHLFPQKIVVEYAAEPPVIQAVRHGDQWITYR